MTAWQRLTLLTALSLAASTACGDEPSSPWAFLPELPPHCSRDQRLQRLTEIGDLEQRFTVLAARASQPSVSVSFDGDLPEAAAASDEMLASLRDLLALPCLEHAAPLLPLPEYARWRSITFAVDSGLFRALRDLTAIHRIHGKRAIAVPPELLPEPDLASRIDLRHLACPEDGTVPCRDSDSALAPLTAELIRQETEPDDLDGPEIPLLELESADRSGRFDDRYVPTARLCADHWRATWQAHDLGEWLRCVHMRAPRQLRYHAPSRIRAVERGWIALRAHDSHSGDYYSLAYYDLATGAAFTGSGEAPQRGGALRIDSGAVSPVDVRLLALALLARPALVRVRAAPLFVEMPPLHPVTFSDQDLTRDREERLIAEEEESYPPGDFNRPGPSIQSATHFVIADGATLRRESYFLDTIPYGTSLFAVRQLMHLRHSLDRTCAPAAFPRLAALALTPPPPPEPNSWACLPSRTPDTFRYVENQLADSTTSLCD